MVSGVHAQLEVRGAEGCPASLVSEECTVESVTISQHSTPETTAVVGEVTVDHADDERTELQHVDEVFADDSKSVYRYSHSNGDCPCSRVPKHGCPIRELRVDSGRLVFSFIAPNLETLREVVSDLQGRCAGVTVRRLTQSESLDDTQSLLFVDRTAFTERQYDVLRTAHRMGYFESPKESNSEAVADALGISVATFVEHLSVAQTKLLEQLLTD
ncbi:helix-turn-helix domain-containing protein [Haladaptatus cibarius]|uniref:helix-turn-helix domain-containing protein n=1 Tax=Haladaptatus cibarius TaxID=453847 RepID=UPI00067916AF|nr:helix-turn-helix domain-containing protein [Haladaptatus cibarius]